MWNKLTDRLIDWLFHKKSPALIVFRAGLLIVIAALSASWVLSLRLPLQNGLFEFSLNTSGDATALVTWAAMGIGAMLMAVGVIWEARRERGEARRLEKKRAIAVELRGLRQVADASLSEAVPTAIEGYRDEVLVDLRKYRHRRSALPFVSPKPWKQR